MLSIFIRVKLAVNLLPPSSQDAIFRVVAAILHLGNIKFTKSEETDSSVLADEASNFHLQMTAELLMYTWLNFTIIIMGCFLYLDIILLLSLFLFQV